MTDDPRLRLAVARQPYPLLFVTISGAHLYGFPSPDSDYDLRGTHILPLPEVVGLRTGRETIESSELLDGLQLDLVSHDVRKLFGMLLKRNGYVLEHVCSPLVVWTTSWHAELLSLVPRCITVQHSHHYLGFAHTQWALFEKESPRRVKPLLYVYRVLLTGIQLMRTGEVEANLERLNETFRLAYIPELIAGKRAGPEHAALSDADLAFHRGEYERLRAAVEAFSDFSANRDTFSANGALFYGGALELGTASATHGQNSTITNSIFDSNYTNCDTGGAIDVDARFRRAGPQQVTLTNDTLTNTTTYDDDGGVIYADNKNAITAVVSIASSVFRNNRALAGDDGGAIFFNEGNANVSNTMFANNRATDAGGSIYNYTETTYLTTITNSTFVQNRVNTYSPQGRRPGRR